MGWIEDFINAAKTAVTPLSTQLTDIPAVKKWGNDPNNPIGKTITGLADSMGNDIKNIGNYTISTVAPLVGGSRNMDQASIEAGRQRLQDLYLGGGLTPENWLSTTAPLATLENKAIDVGTQGVNSVKQGVNDVRATIAQQPGGAQAGFIDLSTGKPFENAPKSPILDAKGNPINKFTPSDMGAYKRNPNTGTIVKNTNPEKANYSIEAPKPNGQASIETGYTAEEMKQIRDNMPIEQATPTLSEKIAKTDPKDFLTKSPLDSSTDIGRTVSPDATKNAFGPRYTAKMQDALVRNGVNSYIDAPKAADHIFNDVIGPELKLNPKTETLDNITNNIVIEMKKLNPGLDARLAKQAASDVINDLYEVSANTGQKATSISDLSLLKIKTDMNSTLPVKNFYKGIPPTNDRELAMIASRNAISETIAQMHPTIAQATRDYGLINDAMPSLFKAYQNPLEKQPNLFSKLMDNNYVKATALGVGLPVALGTGAVIANSVNPGTAPVMSFENQTDQPSAQMNNGGNNPTQEDNQKITKSEIQAKTQNDIHAPIVADNQTLVNTLETNFNKIDPITATVQNPMELKDNNGSPMTISESQYKQINKIIADYRSAHPNDVVASAKADAQQVINENRYNPKLVESFTKASNAMNLIDDSMSYLNNKDAGVLGMPNALDAFRMGSIGIQGLQGGLNSNYKQLSQNFSELDKLYPGMNLQLETSGSKENAIASLNKLKQKIIAQNNQELKNYVGSLSKKTSNNTQITPDMTPTVNGIPSFPTTSTTQDFSGITGGSLPQFDQQFNQ